MSAKRRDNKGRVLRDGESQRSDGQYMFRYTEKGGTRRTIYSWRLTATDKLPEGKRACEALRDMEARIRHDEEDGISGCLSGKSTLNDCFEKYIAMKSGLKKTTIASYKYQWRHYAQDSPLGKTEISRIRNSDVKRFYTTLFDRGLKPSTIHPVHSVIHSVFDMAVQDREIRFNPSDKAMNEIRRSQEWADTGIHALTEKEQTRFLEFLKKDRVYRRWLPLFVVMLGTGCRIGEILALRWVDCDFKNRIININHNLVCKTLDDGKSHWVINTPKTKAGVRDVPMFDDVATALKTLPIGANKTTIDGYSGFIFTNSKGRMLRIDQIDRVIKKIAEKANKEPGNHVLLPMFSAHSLRHTFCTRLCEAGEDLKLIQKIMGHKSITTTMNVYNEVTADRKIEKFKELEGKIKLSGG